MPSAVGGAQRLDLALALGLCHDGSLSCARSIVLAAVRENNGMDQQLSQAVQWLQRAGLDVRPAKDHQWHIRGPVPASTEVVTGAQVIFLARCLERSFVVVERVDHADAALWN